MPKIPLKIGKYKVLSLVGEGGMGAVYSAEHPTLKRTVIIKKLTLTGSRDIAKRFEREARIMMDFRHENIVQVFDHFKEGNAYYIVMEYVDGISLEDLIKKRRFLSNEATLLIFSETCKALKYAHDQMVLHRDIKPANILISKDGVVKLVDFGVSTSLEESEDEDLTKAGMTIGTPSYLAPEQIANAKNRDKRADIYSMGVMLYEMVIGKKPFRGGFTPEVINQIQKGKYTPPGKVNSKIKPVIRKVIKKMMHHKLNRRYQDLGFVISKFSRYLKKYRNQSEMQNDIKLYLEGKEDQNVPRKKIKELKFSSNIPRYSLIVIIVLALIGGGAFWAWQQKYHQEFLFPDEYGVLNLAVKIRKGHKALDERYLKAVLYADRNSSLAEQKDVDFSFKEDTRKTNKGYYSLISQRLVLKQGVYMILLYVDNEQFRESFYLSPRAIQKTQLKSIDGQQVEFSIRKSPPKLPVNLNYQITDMHTGRSLNSGTDVSILYNGKWTSWRTISRSDSLRDGFTSGQRYKFRLKNDGYYSKSFNVTIQPEQSVLTLNFKMVPIPGDLFLKSSSDDIDVLLNNSPFYVTGREDRKYQEIPSLSSGYQKLVLSPGQYFLTAKSESLFSKTSSATRKIQIQSGKKVYLDFDFSSEGQSIKITQK